MLYYNMPRKKVISRKKTNRKFIKSRRNNAKRKSINRTKNKSRRNRRINLTKKSQRNRRINRTKNKSRINRKTNRKRKTKNKKSLKGGAKGSLFTDVYDIFGRLENRTVNLNALLDSDKYGLSEEVDTSFSSELTKLVESKFGKAKKDLEKATQELLIIPSKLEVTAEQIKENSKKNPSEYRSVFERLLRELEENKANYEISQNNLNEITQQIKDGCVTDTECPSDFKSIDKSQQEIEKGRRRIEELINQIKSILRSLPPPPPDLINQPEVQRPPSARRNDPYGTPLPPPALGAQRRRPSLLTRELGEMARKELVSSPAQPTQSPEPATNPDDLVANISAIKERANERSRALLGIRQLGADGRELLGGPPSSVPSTGLSGKLTRPEGNIRRTLTPLEEHDAAVQRLQDQVDGSDVQGSDNQENSGEMDQSTPAVSVESDDFKSMSVDAGDSNVDVRGDVETGDQGVELQSPRALDTGSESGGLDAQDTGSEERSSAVTVESGDLKSMSVDAGASNVPENEDPVDINNVDQIRERIIQIYIENNPRKIGDVDKLLENWKGKEEMLLRDIEMKYIKNENEIDNKINEINKKIFDTKLCLDQPY